MAIKKMDPTPYLNEGESVILKAHAKKNKLAALEVALCYAVLLITVCGDCFLIGAALTMKQLEIKESGYIALVIALFVVHLIPFIFWVVYSIKKMNQKSDKWYALTEKRLLIIQDKKPISVTFIELSEITAMSHKADGIILYFDEERLKIDGLEDSVAFADRLEILAFGEKQEIDKALASIREEESFEEDVEEAEYEEELVAEQKNAVKNTSKEQPKGEQKASNQTPLKQENDQGKPLESNKKNKRKKIKKMGL